MTRTLRNGVLGIGLLAASIGATFAAAPAQAPGNALRVAMFPVTGQAAGESTGPLGDVVGWGRLSAAVILPAVMAAAARACCREWPRGRALQAATGLLYVASGSILGGVLLGNLLRFGPPTAF